MQNMQPSCWHHVKKRKSTFQQWIVIIQETLWQGIRANPYLGGIITNHFKKWLNQKWPIHFPRPFPLIFFPNIIPMTSSQNQHIRYFLESFLWLSLDHSKFIFRNNYFIFTLFINMDIKKQINMCLFMSMKSILI
jgi:hypothetical protein